MLTPTLLCTSENVSFFKMPSEEIRATIEKDTPYIPVKIPQNLPNNFAHLSISETIQQLVLNKDFCIQNLGNTITFVSKHSLEKVTNISIPLKAKVYCSSSGNIYYAFINTLYEWNPWNKTSIPKTFPTEITALAELSDGTLVTGDKAGVLHFSNESWNISEEPIQEILPLSSTWCVLCLETRILIVDIREKTILQEDLPSYPLVIKEDCFLTENPLCLWQYNTHLQKYEKKEDYGLNGMLCKKVSETKVLLISSEEVQYNTTLFDLEDRSKITYSSEIIFNAAQKEKISLTGNGSFFHSYPQKNNKNWDNRGCIGLTTQDGNTKSIRLEGWGADAFLPLTLTTTLCATNSTPSHIYVLSDDGNVLFDDQGSLTNNLNVQKFYTLPDGNILVHFWGELAVLKPNVQKLPYKKRSIQELSKKTHYLFVGEGNFTGVEAFITKHPHLAKYITATELNEPIDKDTEERVQRLQKKEVSILFGIDGTLLDQHFFGRRFERIQWNHPFGYPRQREAFKKVLCQFFQSCTHLQLTGDTIHVTLEQSPTYWKERQVENLIVPAATNAGYRLIRKRKFGSTRYPGYRHNKTGRSEGHIKEGDNSREFVFQKVSLIPTHGTIEEKANSLKDPTQKEYTVKQFVSGNDYYFECSTDEDSDSFKA